MIIVLLISSSPSQKIFLTYPPLINYPENCRKQEMLRAKIEVMKSIYAFLTVE